MNFAIITGSSSGLGLEAAKLLLDEGWYVLGVSRSQAEFTHERFVQQKVDLSVGQEVESFFQSSFNDFIPNNIKRVALLNNAGTIDPVGPINEFSMSQLQSVYTLNLITPVWLMSHMCRQFEGIDLRVINISSGAATSAYEGWLVYCSSKAGLKMASSVLGEEEYKGLSLYDFSPGPMDTKMQHQVRSLDRERFPAIQKFLDLKADGKLVPVEEIALEILEFFAAKSPEKFVSRRYAGEQRNHYLSRFNIQD
ncbi:MAG: SDR family NAD(P)-dependent oxidoreductase [Pseudobacteriovorax sp.]|nr:SDR family NAD(P)-dependent oxidoreductase [Pseudobacteriovorax sp.]